MVDKTLESIVNGEGLIPLHDSGDFENESQLDVTESLDSGLIYETFEIENK